MWHETRLLGTRTARCLTTLVLAAGLLAAPGASAQGDDAPEMTIEVSDERPIRDTSVRLTVSEGRRPAAGAQVTAVYRPNSLTSETEELTPVDSSGTLMWTPRSTGPVTLEVRPAGADDDAPAAVSHTVAVRYGGLPASGLLIMVLAGVLLFGGAAVAFYLLLKPPEHTPAAEPPST